MVPHNGGEIAAGKAALEEVHMKTTRAIDKV